MRGRVLVGALAILLVLGAGSPAAAQFVTHDRVTLRVRWEVKAGGRCEFAYRGRAEYHLNLKMFARRPPHPTRYVLTTKASITYVNLDTGYVLTDRSTWVEHSDSWRRRLAVTGLTWHLRGPNRLVLVRAGRMRVDPTTFDLVGSTPHAIPVSSTTFCAALAGGPG